MADINISVNSSTDLYTIKLDKWEWTALQVNGQNVPAINQGNIQFQFNQTTEGAIHFIATANQYIDLVNEGNILYMSSPDGQKTYMCIISYKETESPKVVTLHGVIHTVDAPIPGSQPSPLTFSQGRMTGTFQTS